MSDAFTDFSANDCEERNSKRQRTDVIQILFSEQSLIWDLTDHEEIKVVLLNNKKVNYNLV